MRHADGRTCIGPSNLSNTESPAETEKNESYDMERKEKTKRIRQEQANVELGIGLSAYISTHMIFGRGPGNGGGGNR